MIIRRLTVATVVAVTSLTVGAVTHAQDDGAATPTTLDVEVTQVTEDDDGSDNTGLWGLLGLIGLVGLGGLAARKRRDTVTTTAPPPVGPAAPKTAQGATASRDRDH